MVNGLVISPTYKWEFLLGVGYSDRLLIHFFQTGHRSTRRLDFVENFRLL